MIRHYILRLAYTPLMLMFTLTAFGQNSQQVILKVGQSTKVDVGFEGKFSVADPSVVRCLIVPGKFGQLELTGLAKGVSDISAYSGNGDSKVFSVRVMDGLDVRKVQDTIQEELARSNLVEVRAEVNEVLEIVVLTAELTDPNKYRALLSIVEKYGSLVSYSGVHFSPNRAYFEKFMQDLARNAEGSFQLVSSRSEASGPGQIFVDFNGVTLSLHGSVVRNRDLVSLQQLIGAHGDWLRLMSQESADPKMDAGKVRVNFDVQLAEVYLTIECMLAGISETKLTRAGVNLAKQGILVLDSTGALFQGLIGRDRPKDGPSSGYYGTYSISSGLQGVQKFLLGEGENSMNLKGTANIKNGDNTKITFDGGTIFQQPLLFAAGGSSDGSISEGRTISFGSVLGVGAELVSTNEVELIYDFQVTTPQIINGTVILNGTSSGQQTVRCGINQTLLVTGLEKSMGSIQEDGVPYLRKIPLLGWFFNEKNKVREEARMVLLLNPTVAYRLSRPNLMVERGLQDVPSAVEQFGVPQPKPNEPGTPSPKR